jgi:UDP-hydrolysing UDP-N-acetyl-D-glucosamine 2-epimerase
MKRIALATFTRAEYGSIAPVMRALDETGEFETQLIVSGTHLSPWHGKTVDTICADGVPIAERVEMQLASDAPEGVAKSIGLAMSGFARAMARLRPELLLLAGDRTELLAPATVALLYAIPVVHLSGGEITEGAIDNQVRHAVSKMSHLHFVCMAEHARRLHQMGEDPSRVHVTGDPALDTIKRMKAMSLDELASSLEMKLDRPITVVTCHPTTLGGMGAEAEVEALLGGLRNLGGSMIVSMPNADVGGRAILARLREFSAQRPATKLFSNLGQERYYSLLAQADLMVGNSSSGIWEAPSFGLPVVNVGDRQRGRTRAGNVIDVEMTADAIRGGIEKALDPAFRRALRGLVNPYGDGEASRRIARILCGISDPRSLLQKRFFDSPPEPSPAAG